MESTTDESRVPNRILLFSVLHRKKKVIKLDNGKWKALGDVL